MSTKYEVLAATDYTLEYVLKTPNPRWPDTVENPIVWKEAIFEYLRQVGIKNPEKLDTKKKLSTILKKSIRDKRFKVGELILWPEVKRIFNKLVQHRKNRPRNEVSKERLQEMKKIKKAIQGSLELPKMKLGDFIIFR